MRLRRMKSVLTRGGRLLVLAAVASMVAVITAEAVVINIDIGVPGGLSNDSVIRFDDLNGMSLTGQSLSLDFLFDEGAFARLFTVTTSYSTALRFRTDGNGLAGFMDGTGYLLDDMGNPLHSAQQLGRASSDTGWMYVGLYPLLCCEFGAPLDHFGVHYDLMFPMNPSFDITSAEFRLYAQDGPFGIGPNLPADIVPDTGCTLFLLLASLVAVIGARRMVLKVHRQVTW